MSQQLADRLNSYALRQGDRRGEGMAGRMECNLLHNAYFGHDFVETGIAPAVARKGRKSALLVIGLCLSRHQFVYLAHG